MKILLDECVPARLGRLLAPHEAVTVSRRGWAGIKNGELLALAEKEFDIFLTVDRRIPTEQALEKFRIAVVVLRVSSNRLAAIRPLIGQLLEALPHAVAGMATIVSEAQ